jgi:hypothetical protein
MNDFENVGVFIWEKVWLENSLSKYDCGRHGGGLVGVQSMWWRVTTHMGATGRYVKELWIVSG